MIFKKFLYAIGRDWGSLVTGGASVPMIFLAFFANTPAQRAVWAVFAIGCFGYASFRIWAAEYRRAEIAESKLTAVPRPWVFVDSYNSVYMEDHETGGEEFVETLRVVNRGDVPALSIKLSRMKFNNRTARLLSPLTSLGPGESIEARVINLKDLMEAVRENTPMVLGQSWSARFNLTIIYTDPSYSRWETKQEVIYTVRGIDFGILDSTGPQESSRG